MSYQFELVTDSKTLEEQTNSTGRGLLTSMIQLWVDYLCTSGDLGYQTL